MNRRAVIAVVGVVVVVVLVVVVVMTRDSDDGGSPTVEDCAEGLAVVDSAAETISQLTANAELLQDANFYATLVAEQRTITFVMEAEPECFTLRQQAGAEGLLEAFRGLLAIADPPPAIVGSSEPLLEGEPDE